MKIVIKTDCDLTPDGKRRAKVVTMARGLKQIHWYVGRERYHELANTAANADLTNDWLAAQK
jgi:hypothetical protein